MNNILLIVSTHGDEKIGLEIIKKLIDKGYKDDFDFLIANPKAMILNKRYVDSDLNRSYPGDKNSDKYEERRASQIFNITKDYKYIIDIHEAREGYRDFIIIARQSIPKNLPINIIDLDKVLLWPEPQGPLSEVLDNVIELEFGVKNRKRKDILQKGSRIIEGFINNIESLTEKDVYYVYGDLRAGDFEGEELKDFNEATIRDESFYPLLVNQYLDLGIICYKMKKLNR